MLPDRIGRYRIVGVLGEGGMGTVYEARQEQPHRAVALKVIRPDLVAPEMARRFAQESEILGRLQHPGIAQIYEADTDDGPDGPRSFFAMELVRGEPLTQYAATRALSVAQRLELFAKVCDAVHYAHGQGVVHRDLKPQNILVESSGDPKILDFGVALVTDGDRQATRQTSIGEVIGTLQYMSPEQINAEPGTVDARSDVYSLGVVLYELLSGQLPYDLRRKLIYEAAMMILSDEPRPISSIDRRLSGDVEVIIGKALEKEPTRRYASATDMASDIRRFLHEEPILARRASAMYQLGKFARRNRALVTGLAVAAIALLAGTVASTALAIRARAAERIADERRADAVRSSALAEQRRAQADSATRLAERRRAVADSAFTVADAARATAERERVAATQSAARAAREAEKSTAVNGFLQRMLTSADPAVAQGAELTVREMLDLAATEGRRDATSRPPEVRAAIDAALGRTYVSLGLFDAARPFLDSAYAVRRRLLGPRDVAVAESADDLGKLAYSVNNAAVAEQRLTEALSTLRATRPPSDDRIVSVVRSLGDVRQRQGRFAAAESLYRDGIRRARIQRPDGGPIVGEMMQSLGSLLAYTGRAREAVALLDTSLTMVRAAYGPSHPQVVWTMTALSDAWGGVPDFPRREAVVREALPIARRIFGDRDHPTIADLTSRLGEVLAQQGRFEEAEAPQRGALRMRIAVLGEPHPDVQLSRQNLGRMLQNTGRMAEADTLFGQALLARRATLGAQSPAVASSLVDIAILAMRREEWARAERAYREARDIWRAAQIADQELYTLAELSLSIARQGRTEQADSILADVLVGRRSRFGDAHWSVGDTYAKQADVAAMRGDFACADSFMVRALAVAEKVYGPRGLPVLGMRLSRATHAEWRGDTTAAVALLREPADVVAARPPTDLPRLNVQRQFATNLCATGAVAQGDSLLRDIVAAMPVDGVRDMPYRLRGALGYCRLRAGRFPESEALLLEAERGLAGFQPAFARTHGIVVSWLVSLYEQWGKPEQVARWRGARRGSGGGGR